MAYRKKAHADLASIKRSRSSFVGAITRARDKLGEMKATDISSCNIRTVDRLLASVATTETGYLYTVEEAHELISKEERAEALQTEEDITVEQFHATVADVRDTAASLISLKTIEKGIKNLALGLRGVRDAFTLRPEADQSKATLPLQDSYKELLQQWDAADHSYDHPLKGELDHCRTQITQLEFEMAGTRDMTPSSSHDLSSSFSSAGGPSKLRVPKLSTIELPTFNGEVMKWATFWTAFSTQVGNREEIAEADKLTYLRKAIRHQPTQDLLDAPREEEDSYTEVVKELKRRFDLPKEVHKNLVQRIMQLSLIKETQDDINKLMDSVRKTLLSLKRTGSYCLESFMTSLVYLILPKKLQVLWEQHTKKEKTVSGVFTMLDFFLEHAATLTPSSLTQSYQSPKPETPEKRSRQQGKRQDNP